MPLNYDFTNPDVVLDIYNNPKTRTEFEAALKMAVIEKFNQMMNSTDEINDAVEKSEFILSNNQVVKKIINENGQLIEGDYKYGSNKERNIDRLKSAGVLAFTTKDERKNAIDTQTPEDAIMASIIFEGLTKVAIETNMIVAGPMAMSVNNQAAANYFIDALESMPAKIFLEYWQPKIGQHASLSDIKNALDLKAIDAKKEETAALSDIDATIISPDGKNINMALLNAWKNNGIKKVILFSTMGTAQWLDDLRQNNPFARVPLVNFLKDHGFDVEVSSPIDIATGTNQFYKDYKNYYNELKSQIPKSASENAIEWLKINKPEIHRWYEESLKHDDDIMIIGRYAKYFSAYEDVINGKIQISDPEVQALIQELKYVDSQQFPPNFVFTNTKLQILDEIIKFERMKERDTFEPTSVGYVDTKGLLYEVVDKSLPKNITSLISYDDRGKKSCQDAVVAAVDKLRSQNNLNREVNVIYPNFDPTPQTFEPFLDNSRIQATYYDRNKDSLDAQIKNHLAKCTPNEQANAERNKTILQNTNPVSKLVDRFNIIQQEYQALGRSKNSGKFTTLSQQLNALASGTNPDNSNINILKEMVEKVETELKSLPISKLKAARNETILDRFTNKFRNALASINLIRSEYAYPKKLADFLNDTYTKYPNLRSEDAATNKLVDSFSKQYAHVDQQIIQSLKSAHPVLNELSSSEIQDLLTNRKSPNQIAEHITQMTYNTDFSHLPADDSKAEAATKVMVKDLENAKREFNSSFKEPEDKPSRHP